jgi:O-antigen/teichoic acid export membrane protein
MCNDACVKEKLRRFQQSSLSRNSLYLLLATGILASFGFFFWMLASHLFSARDIGLATTLISIMNIISLLSLMGFDSAFVRFLPTSEDRNTKINTGITMVTVTALTMSGVFLIFINQISPALSSVIPGFWGGLLFMVFSAMTATNILTDSVFLAGRKAVFTLVINILFSAFRLLLPIFLVSFGAFGVFAAVGLSQSLGLLISIYAMIRWFDYRPRFQVAIDVLKKLRRYIAGNYISGILNLLPATVLPIMITNRIGPDQSGIYYIIMMMGNLLYAIPWATTRSLFAEGSHGDESLRSSFTRAIIIIVAMLIPAMFVLYFFGDFILKFFGKSYSEDGFALLRIITLSAIPVSIYSIFGSYLKIMKEPEWMISVNLFYAIGIIEGTRLLIKPYGLVGVGYAWVIGHILAIIVGALIIAYLRTRARMIRS